MKQKYKIAYINKKHVYQERKETTHREIDKNVITTSSNLYLYIYIYIYIKAEASTRCCHVRQKAYLKKLTRIKFKF